MTFSTRTISMKTRVAVGAFVVAAAAAPAFVAGMTAGDADVSAAPACLAWFGNKEDGKCLSYSNGTPVGGGIGPVTVGAPGSGNPGLTTGPLLPGTSINRGIG
ncbi:hypothetical protein EB74_18120 [Mycobacterium sp. SWH-M5]|nr:hypothetical protein EB74_18120 [Mycobacterium sp. SWH-M5]